MVFLAIHHKRLMQLYLMVDEGDMPQRSVWPFAVLLASCRFRLAERGVGVVTTRFASHALRIGEGEKER